jgi:hypothetical protein
MIGKKLTRVSLVLGVCCMVLVAFASCSLTPNSQEMVISNESDYTIYSVDINQYGVGTKGSLSNVLSEGESIAPGSEKSFYLAPYSEEVRLSIDADPATAKIMAEDSVTYPFSSCYFTFEFENSWFNEKVVATFDGSAITVSGCNAVQSDVD